MDRWIARWLGEFKKSLRNRNAFRGNRIFEVWFYGRPSLNICYSSCSMRNWTWSVFFGGGSMRIRKRCSFWTIRSCVWRSSVLTGSILWKIESGVCLSRTRVPAVSDRGRRVWWVAWVYAQSVADDSSFSMPQKHYATKLKSNKNKSIIILCAVKTEWQFFCSKTQILICLLFNSFALI